MSQWMCYASAFSSSRVENKCHPCRCHFKPKCSSSTCESVSVAKNSSSVWNPGSTIGRDPPYT
ncbi:hypothetical protein K438DRAFT_1867121, partial [Mycena galopus ATCC 62051]